MSIVELVKQQQELEGQLNKEIASHKERVNSLNERISNIKKQRSLIGNGLNLNMIQIAEKVIRVSGEAGAAVNGRDTDQIRTTVRASAIEDAIRDIASGPSLLIKEYIGVKNYFHFGDQRSDCKYGYNPTHGSIVFRIELLDRQNSLSGDEKEAAIYYLQNILQIQKAKKDAA